MEGATGTLYEGEKFQLLFKFSSRYPFDSPQVSARGSAVLLRTQSCCLFRIDSFHSFTQANRSVSSKRKFSKLDIKHSTVSATWPPRSDRTQKHLLGRRLQERICLSETPEARRQQRAAPN